MTAVKVIEWLSLSYTEAIEREDFITLFGLSQSHQLEDMETEYHLASKSEGIIVVFSLDKTITGIQIFSGIDNYEDEDEHFQEYTGSIPFSLNFAMSRKKVCDFLGKPD